MIFCANFTSFFGKAVDKTCILYYTEAVQELPISHMEDFRV